MPLASRRDPRAPADLYTDNWRVEGPSGRRVRLNNRERRQRDRRAAAAAAASSAPATSGRRKFKFKVEELGVTRVLVAAAGVGEPDLIAPDGEHLEPDGGDEWYVYQ